jgi:transcriptional regulator with XRE-family HTH domain
MRNPTLYQRIGEAIARQRKLANMTQAELAAKVDLSRPSVCNIEVGRQAVEVALLYEIAAALGCAPGDLAPKPRLLSRDVIYLRGISHIGDGHDKDRTGARAVRHGARLGGAEGRRGPSRGVLSAARACSCGATPMTGPKCG